MSVATPPSSSRRRRTARRILVVVALLTAVAAVPALYVFSRGTVESYPRAELVSYVQQATSPTWTQPCWSVAPWSRYSTCLHIRGRVLYARNYDPDGDGDRHLFVASRFGVHLVKLPGEMPLTKVPKAGQMIDAVGWMGRGSHGRTELNTVLLKFDGTEIDGPEQG